MSGNPVIATLGRRVRLGVVGGGGIALIGPVHRAAARLDDLIEITAGVLSSDPERSLAQGRALGLPRPYPDLEALVAGERGRPDGIDALAICTPNDSHVPIALRALEAGLHVICDKPLANDLASARELVRAVRASGRVFVLTHNYSGYPMIRQARGMVADGLLGPVHLVSVAYLQGSLATRVEDAPEAMPPRLVWRLDPARGGPSHALLDIGTHAHQLLTYVTGRNVHAVLAEVGALVPGRVAHDTGLVLLRLEGGARGVLVASKAAAGADNALALEVYGPAGGLVWEQADQNRLRHLRTGEPARLLSRGLPGNHPLARRATRIPSGHPEGFHEAFANLYADFAEQVAAALAGRAPDPLACHLPTALDGARGLAFVEACLASAASGGWVELPEIG